MIVTVDDGMISSVDVHDDCRGDSQREKLSTDS